MNQHSVDFVIVTPLAEEWLAMVSRLGKPSAPPDQTIPTKRGSVGTFDVVCVRSGKYESETSAALTYACTLYKPSWVLVCGIAGGFKDQQMYRGNLVIASFVYGSAGKLVEGKFKRRPDLDSQPDKSLRSHAENFAAASGDWLGTIKTQRPDGLPATNTHVNTGYVLSSDMLIDDPEHPFFQEMKRDLPDLGAVEMESSGAASAIHLQQSRTSLRFLMIRGISDEVGAGQGSEQRKQWKAYACDAVSAFVCAFLEYIPELGLGTKREGTRYINQVEPSTLPVAQTAGPGAAKLEGSAGPAISQRDRVTSTRFVVCAFDFDGTLLRGTEFRYSWQLVWQYLGYNDELRRRLFRAYEAGEISYEDWCQRCLFYFQQRKLRHDDFFEIAKRVKTTQQLRDALLMLRHEGMATGVISGGIDTLLEIIIPDYPDLFDFVYINQFGYSQSGLLQTITPTQYDFKGKIVALKHECESRGASLHNGVFVGEGKNDAHIIKEMREQGIGLTIAYPPNATDVEIWADEAISQDNLTLVAEAIIRRSQPSSRAAVS